MTPDLTIAYHCSNSISILVVDWMLDMHWNFTKFEKYYEKSIWKRVSCYFDLLIENKLW